MAATVSVLFIIMPASWDTISIPASVLCEKKRGRKKGKKERKEKKKEGKDYIKYS